MTPGEASQYFSEQPSGPEVRRKITVRRLGTRTDVDHRERSVRRRWPGSRHRSAASCIADTAGQSPDPGLGLRVRIDRNGARSALSWGLGRRGGCERAGSRALSGQRGGAGCRRSGTRASARDVDPDTRYDEIWSNPPIRIGKQNLHELLLTWLARLAPDGVARLVVSKNLGADTLQRWLAEQGYACERAASAKGFRVLVVRRRNNQ